MTKKWSPPGNIGIGSTRYKDMDGDGVLEPGSLYEPGNPDSGDLIKIGNTRLRLPYSLNLIASYKSFDFSMFLQGVGKWNFRNPVRPKNS